METLTKPKDSSGHKTPSPCQVFFAPLLLQNFHQMSPASVSSEGLHENSLCFMLGIQLGSPFCIPQTLMDKLNGAVKAHGKTEVARILAEVPICRCCEGLVALRIRVHVLLLCLNFETVEIVKTCENTSTRKTWLNVSPCP